MARHDTPGGPVWWPFEEESRGTQQLYLVGHRMVIALNSGTPLTIDELEAHLHQRIGGMLVRAFQNPLINPQNAQLLFTTHDTALLGSHRLRRDQVWLTQKRGDGGTELFPLTDFNARNDLSIERAYMDGRFGGVPTLPDLENMMLEAAASEPAGAVR